MPPAFHVIAKPSGPDCNLACGYCFYQPKARLFAPGAKFRMSGAVLEAYVRQHIEAQPLAHVVFTWQGGEPTLMGIDFFERALELQRRYRRPGMTIENAFQTNGVLLDDKWCAFVKANGFLVGLSLDGPAELHDAYRVNRGGRPTFGAAYGTLRRLQRHGVEYNVLCVVNARNVRHPGRVYRFLRGEGVRYIQFIPAVGRTPQGGVTEWTVPAGDWGTFLARVFDQWVARDPGRVHVQHFDMAIGAQAGIEPHVCAHARRCGSALALEHNGDVYACDHYVEPGYRLGNLLETPLGELADSAAQRRFGAQKFDSLPRKCRECAFIDACNGGCPKDRFIRSEDGELGLNYLCKGYRYFYAHAAPACHALIQGLATGRPLAAIRPARAEDRRAAQRAARNSACPCGSGRKFKHCCQKPR